MRPIADRPRSCAMCGAEVIVRSVTSPHAEAPEMLQAPSGVWVGFVQGDVNLEMVIACSEACVQSLLEE